MEGSGIAPSAADDGSGKTALVLSGGGITGFLYEVGALAGLDEASGGAFSANDFDLYVGTSAGAALAALLANGARAEAIFEALHGGDERSPVYLEAKDVFGVGARNPLKLLLDFLRPLPGTVRRAFRSRRWPTFAQVLADYQEHHPPGFYSTEPLESSLCERFSRLGFAHRFSGCPRELYVSGTDLDSAEALVFGAGEFRHFHICRAVAASCAIPIFFRPIRVGERDVVDGAVAEGSPVLIAAEHGAREILFVNPMVPIRNDRSRVCLPLDGGHCARLSEKGIGWIGEQTMRIVLSKRGRSAMEAIRSAYPGVHIAHLEPSSEDALMFTYGTMSFAARRELLEHGREAGRRFFANRALLARLARRRPAPPRLPNVAAGSASATPSSLARASAQVSAKSR